MAQVACFIISCKHRQQVQIGRKPPKAGWTKLNTDGSSIGAIVASCVGLISSTDGERLGGYSKGLGICSGYIEELWGCFDWVRSRIQVG